MQSYFVSYSLYDNDCVRVFSSFFLSLFFVLFWLVVVVDVVVVFSGYCFLSITYRYIF